MLNLKLHTEMTSPGFHRIVKVGDFVLCLRLMDELERLITVSCNEFLSYLILYYFISIYYTK